jgi:hypothetical protein
MYELLNYVAPMVWNNPGQVIYSPRDDLDYASYLYQLRHPEMVGSIILPFAYFSRSTSEVVERTYDHALRPWDPPLSTHPNNIREPIQSNWQVTVIPAILLYVLRVYDFKVEYTEMLFDGLYRKGIREKSTVYHYDSPILHILSPYRIELGNPRYDKIPSLPDRLKGKGSILSIMLPFECRCILGESSPVVRIDKINLNYRSPVCPPTNKIGGIVIDSNTQVKDTRAYVLTDENLDAIATEEQVPLEKNK